MAKNDHVQHLEVDSEDTASKLEGERKGVLRGGAQRGLQPESDFAYSLTVG
jgi:hypothetical protein